MKKYVISLLLVLSTLSWSEVRLLRHPSYHNGKIAFSYLGDIWTANEDGSNVQRITVHKARDVYPHFSPDGKWIAFSSNRYGNYDVFIVPAEGGAVKQLTYHAANDTVVGWSADSRTVIFQSSRGLMYPGIPNLYEVSIEGGLEHAVPTDWGYWGGFSPDGSKFAFNRHPMVWWRQHYRGSYAADLWVMDVKQKTYTHLADGDYKGNYFWPMYAADGFIYFVSDRLPDETHTKPGSREVLKSINNIWKIPVNGGHAVQVTHHTSGRLFFPSISSDGKTIVYEEDFGLWKLDTKTGKSTPIKINIVSDDKENDIETITVRNDTESYDLSPSSKRAAISVHGEIFSIATDRGDIQRVTQSFSREAAPSWSPDGKWIAFISDKSGRDEIWMAREDSTGLKKLSDSDTEKQAIQWAPDSKSLIYAASDRKLYRYDLESGKTSVIASGEAGIQGAHFSPDGKWVAYSKLDRDLRPHVYVIPSTGGSEHHVGNDDVLFSEISPQWTPDGKRLLFLAGLAQTGNANLRQSFVQLYSVTLAKEEKNPGDHGVDDEEQAQAAERLDRQRNAQARGEAPKPDVKIDFDGITRRSHQVTHLSDNITAVAISPDSRLYAFVAVADRDGRPVSTLYTIPEDGLQVTTITTSGRGQDNEEGGGGPQGGRNINTLKFSKDGRSIYFMEGEGLYAVDLGPAAGAAGAAARAAAPTAAGRNFERRRVNFTARVEVDHRVEWKQVFNESWRVMKNRFYDAEMHGVDWARVKNYYEPLLEYVADQEEMHNLVSQMIGELNASHTGISAAPGPEERDRIVQTRYPGFEFENDGSPYYKVAYIYKDGPADKDYVRINPGDYIVAIDGHEVKAGDNYWKYLTAVRGEKIELTINSKPTTEGAWLTKVEPIGNAAYTTLQYQRWVRQRRDIVDKASNGEVGYLHIRAMDAPSLRQFERDLVENHYKKALIIDQRFNPGGGIDQELLEILSQRQYQVTKGRDSVQITRPQHAFFGPMVVMENERSTSDAEVFPDGFRTLGLGKVVGKTTYGAVIGTGAFRLLDGSSIRTPATGLWNVKGYNLENYGVPPDVDVDNTPADFLAGRDAQLEKAVEVLQEEIKKRPETKSVTAAN